MTRTILIAALPALLCGSVWAQPAGDSPVFEVASVKPSPPPEGGRGYFRVAMDGGPGAKDPARIDYRNVSMSNLVVRAYGINHFQLSGPDWFDMQMYDIAANVPPGATKEQFSLMLQNLLAERFKLQVHRETKDLPMYFLGVAKTGKLKPHVEVPVIAAGVDKPPAEVLPRLQTDQAGYPILRPGTTMASMNGHSRLQIYDKDLAWLVGQLTAQLRAPVHDDTGLKGQYDFALYWSTRPLTADAADNEPDLVTAVREQLGLKLEKKKGPVEILVIDHAEKTPTGN